MFVGAYWYPFRELRAPYGAPPPDTCITLLKNEFLLPKALLLALRVGYTAFLVVIGGLMAIFIFDEGFSLTAGFIYKFLKIAILFESLSTLAVCVIPAIAYAFYDCDPPLVE